MDFRSFFFFRKHFSLFEFCLQRVVRFRFEVNFGLLSDVRIYFFNQVNTSFFAELNFKTFIGKKNSLPNRNVIDRNKINDSAYTSTNISIKFGFFIVKSLDLFNEVTYDKSSRNFLTDILKSTIKRLTELVISNFLNYERNDNYKLWFVDFARFLFNEGDKFLVHQKVNLFPVFKQLSHH